MKVVPRTLLAMMGTATGAAMMVVPAWAGDTPVAGAPVRLATTIHAFSAASGPVRYTVTVRPVGGAARRAHLALTTRRPASWADSAPGCRSSGDRTELDCDLGDVPASGSRTLRLSASPGASGAADVQVFATADAANAERPGLASSLASIRPRSGPAVRSAPGDDSPQAEASAPAPGGASSGVRPPAQAPVADSPSAEPSAVRSHVMPAPAPSSVPAPALRHPAAGPPVARAGRPRPAARPKRPAPARAPHAAIRPPHVSPRLSAPPRPPFAPAAGAPPAPPAPEAPPAPAAPLAPPALPVPPAPAAPPPVGGAGAAPAGSPAPIAPGGVPPILPAAPLPGEAAPLLPQVAPRPSPSTFSAPQEGTSELTTIAPAGALRAGRTSTATVIAIAIVGEAGLLWLAAGLTVWRRRRVREGCARPGRPTWLGTPRVRR